MATELQQRPRRAESPRGSGGREGLVVGGLALVALVVVGILRPTFLTATLASPRAIAIGVGFVAAFVGLSALVRRVPSPAARFVILLLPVALVGWFLIRPAFAPTALDEDFPPVASAGDQAADAEEEPGAEEPSAEEPAPAAEGPAPAEAEPAAADAAPAAADGEPAPADAEPAPAEPAPPAAEPVQVATGALGGLTGHGAEGAVSTYSLADGAQIVRFEEVAIDPGPDYFVWLVPGEGATSPDGGVDLGPLAATNGNFNYDVPADFDTGSPFTVLIWCRAFSVEIAAATQTPA